MFGRRRAVAYSAQRIARLGGPDERVRLDLRSVTVGGQLRRAHHRGHLRLMCAVGFGSPLGVIHLSLLFRCHAPAAWLWLIYVAAVT